SAGGIVTVVNRKPVMAWTAGKTVALVERTAAGRGKAAMTTAGPGENSRRGGSDRTGHGAGGKQRDAGMGAISEEEQTNQQIIPRPAGKFKSAERKPGVRAQTGRGPEEG